MPVTNKVGYPCGENLLMKVVGGGRRWKRLWWWRHRQQWQNIGSGSSRSASGGGDGSRDGSRGGSSMSGCVGRNSRSGSHRNHQQDFSDFQIPRRLLPLFVGAVAVMVVVVVVFMVTVVVVLWVVLLLLVNSAKTILLPFALLMTNFVLCIVYFDPRLCL